MAVIEAQFVDIQQRKTYPAAFYIEAGKIKDIQPLTQAPNRYILPGFIDAHVHIESSMLTPKRFSEAAVKHGTVATVSDPYEIANVCGIHGIRYMLDSATKAKVKIHFGAPSCVPATHLETAGARVDAASIEELMQWPDIYYLAEVMNFPAVLADDPEILRKINAAKKADKPIDGHTPGINAEQSKEYFSSGPTTDHECVSYEEALYKIDSGCKILIREGSAAKNFEALAPLFEVHRDKLMFCSDDLHPDDLIQGHINLLVKRALAKGYNMYDVLYAACIHPKLHYNLRSGIGRVGDPADFIVVDNLEDWNVLETWIDGERVWPMDTDSDRDEETINQFQVEYLHPEDFEITLAADREEVVVNIIQAIDRQIITGSEKQKMKPVNNRLEIDVNQDILKITVVNRYQKAKPFTAFIKNFGLKQSAIASSVAHDSHNIVAVGSSDEVLAKAVNTVIEAQGGIAFASEYEIDVLALPVAGLMSTRPAEYVAEGYKRLSQKARDAGSILTAPFMTLSFMALPVIPQLKTTDLGLVDIGVFDFVSLWE